MSTILNATTIATGSHEQLYRWVAFDAVGTLIDPSPPVADAYHAVGQRFGSQLTVDEVGLRFRQAFRSSERGFPKGSPTGAMVTSHDIEEARWRWIVGEVFSDIDSRPHHEQCFRELWDHFARPMSWQCFSDVGESLGRLQRAGYRLAVASNFDRRLHLLCNALPELNLLECRVVSADVGYRKPAPQFYESLVEACGCSASEILMVGDDHLCDVQGPLKSGLGAVHLDRRSAVNTGATVRSLSDLVDVLACETSRPEAR